MDEGKYIIKHFVRFLDSGTFVLTKNKDKSFDIKIKEFVNHVNFQIYSKPLTCFRVKCF